MLEMTSKDLSEHLKSEYGLIQRAYEDFDGRVLTIKSWGSLLTLGGVVVGYDKLSPVVLGITALAAAFLWFLEARWKSFQYSYTQRILDIERFFRGEGGDLAPYQIFTEWGKLWQKLRLPRNVLKIASRPFVFVPYAPIIGLCIVGVLYALLRHL